MSNLSLFGTMDTSTVDPKATSFEGAAPAGWYVGVPQALDVKRNATQTCTGVKVEMRVSDGPLSGRLIFDNFMTLSHTTSPQAHDIGQKKLRQWCDAIGHGPAVSELTPFLGKAVAFRVSKQAGVGTYTKKDGTEANRQDSNRIEQFKAYDGTDPSVAPTVAPARPASAPVVQRAAAPAPAAPPAPAAAVSANKPKMPWETN